MGLDMYLSGKKYIKDWSHKYPDGVIPDDTPAKKAQAVIGTKFPVHEVVVDIGYWRKANAIHKWFVGNVQNGEDNCAEYYVDVDQLRELKGVCEDVLKDKGQAKKSLPTTSGFFFGGTEYDEGYEEDLKDTIKIVDDALYASEVEGMSVYYRSSW